MDIVNSKFNAGESVAGYLYQARLALVLALAKANTGQSLDIAIEKLDDVSFDSGDIPEEMLQTKHHLSKIGSLSDSSADIWKTLRIWSEAVSANPALPTQTKFILITTGQASNGSAASFLRSPHHYTDGKKRDPKSAEKLLRNAAEQSTNQELKKAFDAFLNLQETTRISLLSAIEVLDNQPVLVELSSEIDGIIKFIAPKDKIGTARELLEGWWWGKICSAISTRPAGSIPLAQLEAKLDEIREALRRDNLIYEYEHAEPSPGDVVRYDGFPFVHQLLTIGIGGNRVSFAKRDYFRAFAQRSKWSREHAVPDDELKKYEQTLIEEWAYRFEEMKEANSGVSDGQLQLAGQQIYHWVEREASFPLRSVSTRSLCVGSYHMLSNNLKVGWHRDYEVLLKAGA